MSLFAVDFVTQYNKAVGLLGIKVYTLSQVVIQAHISSRKDRLSKAHQVQNCKSLKGLSPVSASSRSALRNDLNVFKTHHAGGDNKSHSSRVPCSELTPKSVSPHNPDSRLRQKPKVSILQRELDKQNTTPSKQYKSIIQQISMARHSKFRPTTVTSQRSSLSQSMCRSRFDFSGNKTKPLASSKDHKTGSNKQRPKITPNNTPAEQKSFYLQRFKCKIQEEIEQINSVLNNLNRGGQTSRSSKTIHVNISNSSLTPLKRKKGAKGKPSESNFYQEECQRASVQSRSLERSFVSLTNRTQTKSGTKILKDSMTFCNIKRRPLLTTKIAKAL